MKKQVKKLKLAKETVRDLGRKGLYGVAGGERYSFLCNPDQGTYWCASVRVVCKDPTL
jgi:hypothetical protein